MANRGQSPAKLLSEGNIAFDEGWYLEDGGAADVSHLNKIPSVMPYREQSVYHRLPDDLEEGISLCFRAKNIDYRVYVDGKLRYEPVPRESSVYNKSFGNRWNYAPLYRSDAGKTVEVRFHTVYEDDSRLVQLLSCCALIMIPIPLVLYLDAAFGFKRRVVAPVICGLSAAEFVICTVLHFTGVMDYHETLTFSSVILAISASLRLYSILKNTLRKGKSRIRNIYKVLRTIGFMGLGFAAVKIGVQSEFVSQLAYRDGLTDIGNRTAFQERLVELEKEKKQLPGIAIIMFDVNDLKLVNDNQDHQKGDELLVCSANHQDGGGGRGGHLLQDRWR